MAGYKDPPKDKQFKPGKSGNEKGRPHKLPELADLMAEMLGEEKDGKTAALAIVAAMRAKAAKGDVAAARWVFEYAYGKAKEHITFDGKIKNDPSLDLSKLTDAEIKTLIALNIKAGDGEEEPD